MFFIKYKHKISKNKALLSCVMIITIAFIVSIQNLDFYLSFDFNFILSILFVPFVLYIKHKNHLSLRYSIVSLVFLGLYPFLKIQSLYFFGFSFFILFVIESFLGKFNNLPIFLLAVLSPLAIFAIEVFGFPIRLWLTDVSAHIISFFQDGINTSGNQIIVNGNKFTVDPECMGLKMVVTAYLITLFILAWFEKKTKKELSFLKTVIILLIASFLIIACNLFRIIGIIFAKAPPETILHESIGLVSLIIYIVIPTYFTSKLFYSKFSLKITPRTAKPVHKWVQYSLILLIIVLLTFYNFNRSKFRTTSKNTGGELIEINGYDKRELKNGVTQFYNDSILVYYKPISNFYSADHTPMICWKGSGYKLQNQKVINIANNDIYFADLHKNSLKPLFTAWWYENKSCITINQITWRWQLIKGADNFKLINITCENKDILEDQVKLFLN